MSELLIVLSLEFRPLSMFDFLTVLALAPVQVVPGSVLHSGDTLCIQQCSFWISWQISVDVEVCQTLEAFHL